MTVGNINWNIQQDFPWGFRDAEDQEEGLLECRDRHGVIQSRSVCYHITRYTANLVELGETGEASRQSYFDGICCHQAPEITIMFCVFRLTFFRAATFAALWKAEGSASSMLAVRFLPFNYPFCFPSIKICLINAGLPFNTMPVQKKLPFLPLR